MAMSTSALIQMILHRLEEKDIPTVIDGPTPSVKGMVTAEKTREIITCIGQLSFQERKTLPASSGAYS